jgi:hypothetical protein
LAEKLQFTATEEVKMNSSTAVILAICIIAAVAVVAWLLLQKRRSQGLKNRFGPEYERTMTQHGNARRAEAVLEQREKRVEKLRIIKLSSADHDRFASAWRADQARFVDDPKSAVVEADRLVTEVMQARGYPMSNFEQAAEDVSVDHPQVVDYYRRAHEIAIRNERGEASTEDLRRAMVYYRSLFEDLLETNVQVPTEVRR